MENARMKVLVVGATGGSGRAVVEELLSAGHDVTAFSRHASQLHALSDRLYCFQRGCNALGGHRACSSGTGFVIVVLGISENPFRVRLLEAAPERQ